MRIETSEQFLRESGIANPPPVLGKSEVFEGRPAMEIDRIRQLELQTIPKPRLFYIGSATAGGASSAGGALGGAGGPAGAAGGASSQPGSGFN